MYHKNTICRILFIMSIFTWGLQGISYEEESPEPQNEQVVLRIGVNCEDALSAPGVNFEITIINQSPEPIMIIRYRLLWDFELNLFDVENQETVPLTCYGNRFKTDTPWSLGTGLSLIEIVPAEEYIYKVSNLERFYDLSLCSAYVLEARIRYYRTDEKPLFAYVAGDKDYGKLSAAGRFEFNLHPVAELVSENSVTEESPDAIESPVSND